MTDSIISTSASSSFKENFNPLNRIKPLDFLSLDASIAILDVRSPSEYAVGHIPSAISFPLFTDEERAVVGTIYKQKSKKEAVKKGLEIVGPKMVEFVELAEHLNSSKLALYCWRGGMRSESMAWLLGQYGFETIILEGGYKAYRNKLHGFFDQKLPLRVVTGYTGSKKTEFLLNLKAKDEQVVDLEGLAQHQGSSFGNQKSINQPETEHFQNLVYQEFMTLDLNKTIWIEDESMHIGKVCLPENLYKQKNESPHVFIEIEKSQRVNFLIEDYGALSTEQLSDATQAISKKLGHDNASKAIDAIGAGDLKTAVEIILTYYDRQYHKSISRKRHLIEGHYKIDINKLYNLADELIKKEMRTDNNVT
ncbi:MAG: tRNA 2-selenouridine(34) synthase MnmH [Cytophagales bacterium]|nr:tRNA 2-selenouridine(34) synthase MnmH [Cytophagales bacterium]